MFEGALLGQMLREESGAAEVLYFAEQFIRPGANESCIDWITDTRKAMRRGISGEKRTAGSFKMMFINGGSAVRGRAAWKGTWEV